MKTSKMTKAKEIFAVVNSRKEFIEKAIEAGLTKHGAATYYQNIKNEAKGESLYKYNKTASNSNSNSNSNKVEQEAEQIEQDYVPVNRWLVVENDKPVACFSSRQKAQDYAKENGLKWKDANKI